jgi:hypothetical protein
MASSKVNFFPVVVIKPSGKVKLQNKYVEKLNKVIKKHLNLEIKSEVSDFDYFILVMRVEDEKESRWAIKSEYYTRGEVSSSEKHLVPEDCPDILTFYTSAPLRLFEQHDQDVLIFDDKKRSSKLVQEFINKWKQSKKTRS